MFQMKEQGKKKTLKTLMKEINNLLDKKLKEIAIRMLSDLGKQ